MSTVFSSVLFGKRNKKISKKHVVQEVPVQELPAKTLSEPQLVRREEVTSTTQLQTQTSLQSKTVEEPSIYKWTEPMAWQQKAQPTYIEERTFKEEPTFYEKKSPTLKEEYQKKSLTPAPVPPTGEFRGSTYKEGTVQKVERRELPKEQIERPPVVHEKIRREEVEELQPIIYREREVREVRKITQPIYEREVRPVQIHETTLPAEYRTEGKTEEIKFEQIMPSKIFEGAERRRIEKPPIIVETVKRQVIEEIQPIIYREIHEPHIIKATKPIYEKVIERPSVMMETQETRFEDKMPLQHTDEFHEVIKTGELKEEKSVMGIQRTTI